MGVLAGVQVQLAGATGPPITVELGPHGTLQKLRTSVAKAFKHSLGGKVGPAHSMHSMHQRCRVCSVSTALCPDFKRNVGFRTLR